MLIDISEKSEDFTTTHTEFCEKRNVATEKSIP